MVGLEAVSITSLAAPIATVTVESVAGEHTPFTDLGYAERKKMICVPCCLHHMLPVNSSSHQSLTAPC